jgi:hypothetical protein
VNEEDVQRKKDLDFWIGLCLDFNPQAQRSKKKAAATRKAAGQVKKVKPETPVKKKKPVANKKK